MWLADRACQMTRDQASGRPGHFTGAQYRLAQPSGPILRLWAAVASPDGQRLVGSNLTGPLDEPESLGVKVARELNQRGADILLTSTNQ